MSDRSCKAIPASLLVEHITHHPEFPYSLHLLMIGLFKALSFILIQLSTNQIQTSSLPLFWGCASLEGTPKNRTANCRKRSNGDV